MSIWKHGDEHDLAFEERQERLAAEADEQEALAIAAENEADRAYQAAYQADPAGINPFAPPLPGWEGPDHDPHK